LVWIEPSGKVVVTMCLVVLPEMVATSTTFSFSPSARLMSLVVVTVPALALGKIRRSAV